MHDPIVNFVASAAMGLTACVFFNRRPYPAVVCLMGSAFIIQFLDANLMYHTPALPLMRIAQFAICLGLALVMGDRVTAVVQHLRATERKVSRRQFRWLYTFLGGSMVLVAAGIELRGHSLAGFTTLVFAGAGAMLGGAVSVLQPQNSGRA
jgi:Sec-independent protein secretion pathway component TatC